MSNLENQVAGIFKGLPALPKEWRDWMAKYAWVFELVFVVLGVFAFIALLGLLGLTSTIATAVGAARYVGYEIFLAWAALLVFGAELVVGIMAVPKLKAMQKAGWNLAFWVALFNLAYGVFNALAQASFGSFISQLISSGVSLYVLFQIREYFK